MMSYRKIKNTNENVESPYYSTHTWLFVFRKCDSSLLNHYYMPTQRSSYRYFCNIVSINNMNFPQS